MSGRYEPTPIGCARTVVRFFRRLRVESGGSAGGIWLTERGGGTGRVHGHALAAGTRSMRVSDIRTVWRGVSGGGSARVVVFDGARDIRYLADKIADGRAIEWDVEAWDH